MSYGGYTYIDYKYEPTKDDFVVLFWVSGDGDLEKLAEGIAAESSIGTWTKMSTLKKSVWNYRARVFKIVRTTANSGFVYVAYPLEHFDKSNVLQFAASVLGNIFGMKELHQLKVLDISFPLKFQKQFNGPRNGLEGLREYVGTKKSRRPHVGTIVKPKVGLNPKQFAKVAYDAYIGGIDFVKDDENLVNQKFCPWEDRLHEMLKVIEKVEDETGRKVLYSPNITGPINEMLNRVDAIVEAGWKMAMIDVYIIGFGALQEVINELQTHNLFIHAHRAGYAAHDRGEYGVSFRVYEKFYRLFGVDALHVGTGVGKMEGSPIHIRSYRDIITESKGPAKEYLGQLEFKWSKSIKPLMPVASGGLHAGDVEGIVAIFGKDVTIQAGGGVHGHPGGTVDGAKSMRQAVEAVVKGKSLPAYAKSHKELRLALKKWGYVDPKTIKAQLDFMNKNSRTFTRFVHKNGLEGLKMISEIGF